ncbi:MAG: GNAT family N-acetyltransferase [Candidatus Limiplasma sp.]|nr:GNAT family N-acetyltransferase [Candidatus Limiplasma sp.]
MHVYHPAQTSNGIPPENVFLIADSANVPVAEGFLIHTYHPYLFAERPINMYISVQSKGPGREMLLGALLARAYQLRLQTPYLKARVFAQVSMQDAPTMSFYIEGGFQADDALDVVQLNPPATRPAAPMGYDLGPIPLQNPLERQAFLVRMNTYRLDVLQLPLLERAMASPHFLALYMARGSDIAGEILFAGENGAAKVMGLYIMPKYRRLGLAKALIACGMKALSEQGVTRFEGDVIRRNVPQCMLAQSCNATFIRTACFYPGLNYD